MAKDPMAKDPMTKHPITKDQVLEKLESIYHRAFEEGKLSVALRAAEMQAKALGMFVKPQRLPDVVRIADMSEEQLSEFIARIEARSSSPGFPPGSHRTVREALRTLR